MNIQQLVELNEKKFNKIINNAAQETKQDTTNTDELVNLLATHSIEFEDIFTSSDSTVKARLVAVLLASSSSPERILSLPASDLLSIATVNRTHAELVARPAVSIVTEALAHVVSKSEYSRSIRAGASRSMLACAVPSAYFQEEGKCNVDGITHDSHDSVPIDRLTRVYSLAVNSMITCVVDCALLRKISASLAIEEMKDGSEFASIADSTMEFCRILLQNSTQSYAIFRKHLSKDCPEFVPGIVLPRLRGIVLRAKMLQQEFKKEESTTRHAWLSVQKTLSTCLCLMALLTFKIKAMRGEIAKVDPLGSLLDIDMTFHPHILAVLIKLHVNIEGGFGPGWRSEHKRTLHKIRKRLEKLAKVSELGTRSATKQILKVRAFHEAMHSHTVPFNRKSRAYADCAYAWRIQELVKPGEELGGVHSGGRGYVGQESQRQNQIASQLAKTSSTFFPCKASSSAVNLGGGALLCSETTETTPVVAVSAEMETENEKNTEKEKEKEEEVEMNSEKMEGKYSHASETETIVVAEPIVFAEAKQQTTAPERKYEHEETQVPNASSSLSSSYHLSKTVSHTAAKTTATITTTDMELDEMDALLLGLDRGPPPSRFLCGLTGAIMTDPLKHPRLKQVWVDRDALENYIDGKKDRVRWPGAPGNVEPFLPSDISEISSDAVLRNAIQKWQIRKGF